MISRGRGTKNPPLLRGSDVWEEEKIDSLKLGGRSRVEEKRGPQVTDL